jgi:hypothetical protein
MEINSTGAIKGVTNVSVANNIIDCGKYSS